MCLSEFFYNVFERDDIQDKIVMIKMKILFYREFHINLNMTQSYCRSATSITLSYFQISVCLNIENVKLYYSVSEFMSNMDLKIDYILNTKQNKR